MVRLKFNNMTKIELRKQRYEEWLKSNFLRLELEHQRGFKKTMKIVDKAVKRFKRKGIVVKAWTIMMCEHTWFFETEEQRIKAHELFNRTELDGWYYCFDELNETKNWYVEKWKEFNDVPTIHYY